MLNSQSMNSINVGAYKITNEGSNQGGNNNNCSNIKFVGNVFDTHQIPIDCNYLITSSTTWIIDSGASNHMCFDKSALFSIKTLEIPHSVTLPNGQKTHAYNIGNTYIADNVVLSNILYVPMFRYNLLSIGRLCKQLKAFVVLSKAYCFLLQGPSPKRPLVLVRYAAGLYFV